MKCTLFDALHARPANLLVRLVNQHAASVELFAGGRHADGRKILDLLALGVQSGDEVEIVATGPDADRVLASIAELIARNFDADLVPELGAAAVEGVAIGTAWLIDDLEPRSSRAAKTATPVMQARRGETSHAEELARLRRAIERATHDVAVLVHALPVSESGLFIPELAILADVEAFADAQLQRGATAEEAVESMAVEGVADLVLDARTRLLEALAYPVGGAPRPPTSGPSLSSASGALGTECILVARSITPSLVATLPASVCGIVVAMVPGMKQSSAIASEGAAAAAGLGYTSHAAILARSRGIPLVYVPEAIVDSVAWGDTVVIDTTESPARVWVAPSAALLHRARALRDAQAALQSEEDARVLTPLALGLAIRVNIGSLDESVPKGAEGIGLVRTELLFAGRQRPPTEAEQFAVLLVLAARAGATPVNVRLFDAGGDKPLAFLRAPSGAPDVRGIELLFAHPEILQSQLRAIARAREVGNVRALIPLVRGAGDVVTIRQLLGDRAEVGAMVETEEAVGNIDAIAATADFICIGSNDLAASILRAERASMAFTLDPAVLRAIERIVTGAHLHARSVTVCGEIAGDILGSRVLAGLGVDAISVAPNRMGVVKKALAEDNREACMVAAAIAMQPSRHL